MPIEDQAHELLQFISEGFVFVDTDFRVQAMNREGERLEGRPAQSLIGTILWESWPGIEHSELGDLWRKAMADREPVSLEHRYSWPDGRQAWLEMRAFPSDDGLAIFYRDISDRKQSEEALKKAQAELMHASRLSAMGTMAATLAHEIAQPLTSIHNYVEAAAKLVRTIPGEELRQARQALHHAGNSVTRANEILTKLRNFVAKGRIETEVQDLQSIIADASVLILPQAQREGVEIQFRLDRNAKWVEADAIQIQQVLINLIRNAMEAMQSADRRQITIATAALPSGSIEIAVEDTGPGFDEEPDALFSPFHSTKQKGLGVGLSISRTIVEAHGGAIEAKPAATGGAIFRFTLPKGRPSE